jgi:hypothetical protein
MVKRNPLPTPKKDAPGLKRAPLTGWILCCAAAILLSGCLPGRQIVEVHPESLVLPAGMPGPWVSLARGGDVLLAVYSDKATTTLNMVQIPVSRHLPAEPPAAVVIDKIDVAPPLSPRFGAHVLSLHEGAAAVLYEDRESDTKTILKAGVRKLAEPEWNLDILEPVGDPVALLPSEDGGFDAFWAAESLLARRLQGDAVPAAWVTPFAPGGVASLAGVSCFTAFNAASRSLLAVQRDGAGFSWTPVEGAGAVHSSLISDAGLLSVLSWEASSRRLVFFDQKAPGEGLARSIVTLCDNTDSVVLLPGRSPRSHVFLFDESRQMGGGAARYQLSLIAPGSMLGKPGARYRKAVLASADTPVSSFSAVVTADALYVLILQKELTLLRVALAP